MDKDVRDMNRDELVEYCGNIRALAEIHEKVFKPENYRWRLGARLLWELKSHSGIVSICPECPVELFGISVEIDYGNPERLELWKNITNDL